MEAQKPGLVSMWSVVCGPGTRISSRVYGWEDVERAKAADNDDANMVFLAINRSYGRNSNGMHNRACLVSYTNNLSLPSSRRPFVDRGQ
jgi:hypothetical protein